MAGKINGERDGAESVTKSIRQNEVSMKTGVTVHLLQVTTARPVVNQSILKVRIWLHDRKPLGKNAMVSKKASEAGSTNWSLNLGR